MGGSGATLQLEEKFRGLGVSELWGLKQLKGESQRLKRMVTVQIDIGSGFYFQSAVQMGVWESSCVGLFRSEKPTDNPFIEAFNGSFRDECYH